jgi:hypothetical protein
MLIRVFKIVYSTQLEELSIQAAIKFVLDGFMFIIYLLLNKYGDSKDFTHEDKLQNDVPDIYFADSIFNRNKVKRYSH